MFVNAEIGVGEIESQIGHVPDGRIGSAVPGKLHLVILGKRGDLPGGGEASDVGNMVTDIVDQTLFHERPPFMRVIPEFADRQRRGALLSDDPIVACLFRRKQILAIK